MNTIINYYMLDREGRLDVDRRMKQASPLLGMDTRMCIIYRMSEGKNEFAVDKSIHKDIPTIDTSHQFTFTTYHCESTHVSGLITTLFLLWF
jgi:hypothetical protein